MNLTQHEKRLRAMPCVVSGRTPVTLHHAHGGSMRGILRAQGPGMAQRSSDWLRIPLHAEYHCFGQFAADGSVGIVSWETKFGTQVEHLEDLSRELGVNLFKMAGLDHEVEGC